MSRGIAFGVFDLFHVGHLRYLQYAADHCDHLWVGVRGDSLTTPGKPHSSLFDEAQRLELIRGLACVDYAFIFSQSLDDSRYWCSWLCRHQIEIVIVGGDWQYSPRWNHLQPCLEREGIQVQFAPRTTGVSSTQIRQKILASEGR
jgi:glycerol-3-phosphate cytidylyltransferase